MTNEMDKFKVLEFQAHPGTIRLYAINPGETWRKDRYVFTAKKTASLIYERADGNSYHVQELDLRDASTWAWIFERMTPGMVAALAA